MRGARLALVLAAMVSVATGGFELRTGKPRSILPDRISGGAERRAARRQRVRGQHAPRPAGRSHAARHRGPRRLRQGCHLVTWIPGGVPAGNGRCSRAAVVLAAWLWVPARLFV